MTGPFRDMVPALLAAGHLEAAEPEPDWQPDVLDVDRHDVIRHRCETCRRFVRAGRRWCDARCQQDARSR